MKATLLSLNGAPVWKIGNEIVTGMSYESIRFPELPDNLYERPTLLWTLQNSGARRHRVEASYLTSNLSWSADYVLNVGEGRNQRRSRRLGHAGESQRDGVQECATATGRRRHSPRRRSIRHG